MKIIDYNANPFRVNPLVRRAARLVKSGNALDVGAGYGRHALFLVEKGFDVTALDISKEKLAAVRRETRKRGLKISCVRADVAKWKPRKRYDLVVANMVIHFLRATQVPKVIEMLKRHTKPRGIHLVTVYTTANVRSHTRPHLFAKDELKSYYRGWEILWYSEKWGLPFRVRAGEKPVRRHGAKLIARKPAST